MIRYIALSLIVISIGAQSCKKKDREKQEGYLENTTPHALYVDIFEPTYERGPMHSSMRLIAHEEVAPYSRIDLRQLNLEEGANYLYDWYTGDYRYSWWMRPGNSSNFLMFNYNPWVKLRIRGDEAASDERLVCLSGNGVATVWKTVDAYDLAGNSVWTGLSDKKHHTISILYHHSVVDSNWEGPPVCIPTGMMNSFTLSDTDRFWLQTNIYPDPDLILTNKATFIAMNLTTESKDTLYYVKHQRTYNHADKSFSSQTVPPVYKIAKVETRYRENQTLSK